MCFQVCLAIQLPVCQDVFLSVSIAMYTHNSYICLLMSVCLSV